MCVFPFLHAFSRTLPLASVSTPSPPPLPKTQTGYGAFWIAFSFLNIFKVQNVYDVSDAEVGAFLTGFAIFTFVLFVASLRRSKMEVALFFTLLVGLVFASIQVCRECGYGCAYMWV